MDAWHQIAMSLRGAYLTIHRYAESEFARYGISADQFPVLTVLRDGAVHTQSEVCAHTYSDPNTMGAMLALMETRGLLKRMRHEKDQRTRTVELTRKGKRIFEKLLAGREAVRDRMVKLFPEADVERLVGLLQRIIRELSPSRKVRTARARRSTKTGADKDLVTASKMRSK